MLTSAQCKAKLDEALALLMKVDGLMAEVQQQVEEEGYYDAADYNGDVCCVVREDINTLQEQCDAF